MQNQIQYRLFNLLNQKLMETVFIVYITTGVVAGILLGALFSQNIRKVESNSLVSSSSK